MSILPNTISTADESILREIDSYISARLSAKRLLHSRETAKLAQELCIKYNVPPAAGPEASSISGALAGMAHDLAREYSGPELVAFIVKNGIIASSWEMEHPVVLHGKVAAHVARKKWGLDRQICQAITDHVLGRPGMPVLSRILFIADFCEPSRGFLEEQKRVALLALPLTELLLRTTELIFDYLEKEHRDIAQVTKEMYQFFKREQ